jgi:DNA replication and repair protein RecF
VFFGPDDLDIVRGEPSHRRRFLDEAVTTLWPLKESLISAFDRALRQRNRLLKEHEGGGPPPGIEAWDEELVVAGTALTRARADAVTRVAPRAEDEFLALSGYGLEVSYARNVPEGEPLEEAYRSRIAERRADEVLRRTTLVGPHRDDVALAVRDLGARAFASHGEAWGAALALRMGLAAAAGEELGEPPVWLLDDPFSALDPGRRRNVAERLVDRGQVVVSVADEAHVPAIDATVWDLRAGSVSPRAGVGRGTGP